MKLLRTAAIAAAALTTTMTATTASAEYQYGFGNVSINRLNWSDGTQERTKTQAPKRSFTFLELEGGAGFDWGEVYGFIDLENPHKKNNEDDGDGLRIAMKGTMRVFLGDTGLNLYGQIYDLSTGDFDEQNRVIGFGYNYANDNLFFKPFIGLHNAQSKYFKEGNNGYMLGWVLGYNFNAFNQSFSVTNWNEYEFGRDKKYQTDKNDKSKSKKSGINGAVSLWWNATDNITAGLQYRYANDKLGSATYQNAMIYTLKYNF
ncbi:ion channel protein Tsx [Endozoicomonas gorgoniicola]|uniref:Ion channel protein Tsx n=1 Tax=Endozoicomonas gorgoniicola TaxID=1234144 RepID=A0ABT3MVK9_9GAMM|nr:outer membrane protein OmpK [Endozoicomonas gorgoniicola]MCW7553138.1 ion channel protein Tsx [Endozoicomonas gorgoniicola]